MAAQEVIDDGKAIMEEMVGENALDDPDYILQNLTLISALKKRSIILCVVSN